MTPSSKPPLLTDPKRFKTIQDSTRMRPDCGASIDDILVVDNEWLLITDLASIGTLMNPYSGHEATYIRLNGVVVESYVNAEPIPVLWQDPILLFPASHHLRQQHNLYKGMANVVGSISCPSGAFLLLPFRQDIPTALRTGLDTALAEGAGVNINLPNANYRVFYEQFEAPEGEKEEYFRNIAIQKQ